MPEVVPSVETFARIKVLGLGGGGGEALNRMIDMGVENVEFVAVNTDAQALDNAKATTKLHIGKETTRGLGAGADPQIGQQAAEESMEDIKQSLEGTDMAFIMMCAGGGTASGAAPLVAEAARQQGILTVGFATRPFAFEGETRRANADSAIERMRKSVDTLITIPNDRLLQTIDRKTPLLEAFSVVDDVLRQGVQGISNLITVHGLINLDFADVRSVMDNAGSALMGIGSASGEDRAVTAAREAIESPLLEVSIDGARGVLFNVTGGRDMGMHEINEAAETITSAIDPDANIIFGATIDENLEDELRLTVVATGFDAAVADREPAGGLAYFNKPNDGETVTDEDLPEQSLNLDEETPAGAASQETDAWSFSGDDDDFDVPAFVRNRDRGEQQNKDEKADQDGQSPGKKRKKKRK
ncbi:cell division protein FtsZ [Candidatus Saccharibacteria bacterium QS_5_54_17]|nr:MAG: cell division protein FtsZ [Candidatus Saccharibacteria bacterium QS_5_54_17]